MKLLAYFILMAMVGIGLAIIFDGKQFALRCVLIFPFSFLFAKQLLISINKGESRKK